MNDDQDKDIWGKWPVLQNGYWSWRKSIARNGTQVLVKKTEDTYAIECNFIMGILFQT